MGRYERLNRPANVIYFAFLCQSAVRSLTMAVPPAGMKMLTLDQAREAVAEGLAAFELPENKDKMQQAIAAGARSVFAGNYECLCPHRTFAVLRPLTMPQLVETQES